jgi:hypothetical protein
MSRNLNTQTSFPGRLAAATSGFKFAGMHRLFVLLALFAPAILQAQTPAKAAPAPAANAATQPIFRATLPGGTYEVATRAMIAVSSHEYIVDAVARVTEVNIDTTGSMLVRFYFLEPNAPNAPLGIGTAALEKAQALLTDAGEKSGQEAWKKVVKNYPTTTHARTVEFRVASKDDLTKIFTAADEAFRFQRPTTVTIE